MSGNDAKLTTGQLELEIIRQLQKGILQPSDIARNIDPCAPKNSSHVVRVYRRMQALQQRGVILGYYAKLSLEKIGYANTALFHVTLNKPINKSVLTEFEADARHIKQIVSLHFVDDVKLDYAGIIALAAKRDFISIAAKIKRCRHVNTAVILPVLRSLHLPATPPALRLAP
jgi:DNA-binding Lrp family transcriptional regulator